MKNFWLESERVCLAMGDAVALNLMFETQQDHQIFLNYWNKYLGGMADLLNYYLSPTGWVLLFKTKREEEIHKAYHTLRAQSKKAQKKHQLDEVGRILSEHFRIFLSQYVRRTNAIHQRKGAKVMQRFSKYVFHDSAEYEYIFECIMKKLRRKSQPLKKYQADETAYDLRNEMKEDSVWKVGLRVYDGLERGFQERFSMVLMRPKSSVLRKLLDKVTPRKNHKKSPHFYSLFDP